jgi:hypothetical protein
MICRPLSALRQHLNDDPGLLIWVLKDPVFYGQHVVVAAAAAARLAAPTRQ